MYPPFQAKSSILPGLRLATLAYSRINSTTLNLQKTFYTTSLDSIRLSNPSILAYKNTSTYYNIQ
jgi:hypothetical protein